MFQRWLRLWLAGGIGLLTSCVPAARPPATPTPDINVIPTSLDFGTGPAGTNEDRPINIQNLGTAALIIDSLGLSFIGTPAFSLVNPPATPFAIPAVNQRSITIRCAHPLGSNGGTFTISSNDPDENPTSVSLLCTGLEPPSF